MRFGQAGDIADPPKLDLLRLEITELDGFEGSPNVVVKSLPLGKQTKIEFAEPPGAEIEVRFQKLPTGNLAVRLEPLFREGESKEFDLTLPRLKTMEEGVTRALQTAERELPAEKQKLAAKEESDFGAEPHYMEGDWRSRFADEAGALVVAWAAPGWP